MGPSRPYLLILALLVTAACAGGPVQLPPEPDDGKDYKILKGRRVFHSDVIHGDEIGRTGRIGVFAREGGLTEFQVPILTTLEIPQGSRIDTQRVTEEHIVTLADFGLNAWNELLGLSAPPQRADGTKNRSYWVPGPPGRHGVLQFGIMQSTWSEPIGLASPNPLCRLLVSIDENVHKNLRYQLRVRARVHVAQQAGIPNRFTVSGEAYIEVRRRSRAEDESDARAIKNVDRAALREFLDELDLTLGASFRRGWNKIPRIRVEYDPSGG